MYEASAAHTRVVIVGKSPTHAPATVRPRNGWSAGATVGAAHSTESPPLSGIATAWGEVSGTPSPSARPSVSVRLSIVVPAYNEANTIGGVVGDLLSLDAGCPVEVIVVDDGSRDATRQILSAIRHPRLRVINHDHNKGKGAALRTGMQAATGTHMLPFDADSEYDAADIPRLLEPVIRGRAEIVYGARIPGMNTVFSSCWYPVGSWVTTWVANALFSARLKDLHTCLKLIPLGVAQHMGLQESGFGLDTEVTARLLKMGLRPFEVPVSYRGRSRAEGKKISWRDGVRCLAVLVRVRMSRSVPSTPPKSTTQVPPPRQVKRHSCAVGTDEPTVELTAAENVARP